MMKKVIFLNTLAILIFSCGPAENPENPEDGDVGEECVDTWWYLEQDGEIVLQGDIAKIGEIPGTQYSQGFFTVDDNEPVHVCNFYSMKPLSEGIHDNLTCVIGTDQGPNPQWLGAETDSDGDHRPIITSLNYDGIYTHGIMEGTMFRLETFSLSPPNVEGKIVNYRFEFNALNNKISADYEICAPRCSLDGLAKYCRDKGCTFENSGGSHAKCRNGSRLVTTIPRHPKVAPGTCNSIIKAIDNGCS